ncbi:hypothetical protein U9M48_039984 [Paspalum notatum var. saurae]|uniref:Uncharacterized protein n=1 Tax=Paspalum notatum var. saurae TaxID=547442 RepID=A0AAQ3UPF2_PASNO
MTYSGKIPVLGSDGYPYCKGRMEAFLISQSQDIWDATQSPRLVTWLGRAASNQGWAILPPGPGRHDGLPQPSGGRATRPMGCVDLHLTRLWSKRGRGGAAAMVRFPRGYSQQNDHVLLPSMRVVAGVTVVLDLRGMEQEEGPTFVYRSLQLSSQASMT